MSPRRVAKHWSYGGVDFEPENRVFFMFGSPIATRPASPSRSFRRHARYRQKHRLRRRPHYCAGAFASRAMVADVALPGFRAAQGLAVDTAEPVRIGGWRFAGCSICGDMGCGVPLLARAFVVGRTSRQPASSIHPIRMARCTPWLPECAYRFAAGPAERSSSSAGRCAEIASAWRGTRHNRRRAQIIIRMMLTRSSDPLDHSIHPVHRT